MTMNAGKLVDMMVVALIFGVLIGLIADYTIGVNASASNVTGTTYTLLILVPLALAIVVVVSFFKLIRK